MKSPLNFPVPAKIHNACKERTDVHVPCIMRAAFLYKPKIGLDYRLTLDKVVLGLVLKKRIAGALLLAVIEACVKSQFGWLTGCKSHVQVTTFYVFFNQVNL